MQTDVVSTNCRLDNDTVIIIGATMESHQKVIVKLDQWVKTDTETWLKITFKQFLIVIIGGTGSTTVLLMWHQLDVAVTVVSIVAPLFWHCPRRCRWCHSWYWYPRSWCRLSVGQDQIVPVKRILIRSGVRVEIQTDAGLNKMQSLTRLQVWVQVKLLSPRIKSYRLWHTPTILSEVATPGQCSLIVQGPLNIEFVVVGNVRLPMLSERLKQVLTLK